MVSSAALRLETSQGLDSPNVLLNDPPMMNGVERGWLGEGEGVWRDRKSRYQEVPLTRLMGEGQSLDESCSIEDARVWMPARSRRRGVRIAGPEGRDVDSGWCWSREVG